MGERERERKVMWIYLGRWRVGGRWRFLYEWILVVRSPLRFGGLFDGRFFSVGWLSFLRFFFVSKLFVCWSLKGTRLPTIYVIFIASHFSCLFRRKFNKKL